MWIPYGRAVFLSLRLFARASPLNGLPFLNWKGIAKSDGIKTRRDDLEGHPSAQVLVDAALGVVVGEGLEECVREESHADNTKSHGEGARSHFKGEDLKRQ